MNLDLEGRIAIVTGGSRGLGRAAAESLAKEGARVAICARNTENLERTAGELAELGMPVTAISADVTSADDRQHLMDEVAGRLGPVDILVNNVGGNRRGPMAEVSDDDWRALIDLNLMSHIQLSRMAIPAMRETGRGVILMISSIYGREFGHPGAGLYHTTKAAVIAFAKALAMELAAEGIRVNSIAPGSIRFPGGSWDRRCQADPGAMKAFVESDIPMGRFGTAGEVGDVVAFLASDRASWITGACVNVDGGQSHSMI